MVVAELAGNELDGRVEGIMKVVGNIGKGCELENHKNVDQVIMHGFVRSLSGSILLKPGVDLEVELGLGHDVGLRDGLDNKRKGVEVKAQGLKSDFQCGLKSALRPMLSCSDMFQTYGDPVCLSKEIHKKKREEECCSQIKW
ncbi:hypothetical protein HYC85_028707 [Camellia sinensis]|uniref:Uncharacterized protein n=1 Tax=Camellia sinensis TaxID=4442 RepID=A0A7J7FZW3_CAMSI|nr:hypothetical protein HYC85_028707 [Camellia sinensis]